MPITFYNHYTARKRPKPPLQKWGKTKTQQHLSDEVSIKGIVARIKKGEHVELNKSMGAFIDTTVLPKNLQELHEMGEIAKENFARLPAAARRRFEDNPFKMVAFIQNPKNREECIRLGLMEPVQKGLKDMRTNPPMPEPSPAPAPAPAPKPV